MEMLKKVRSIIGKRMKGKENNSASDTVQAPPPPPPSQTPITEDPTADETMDLIVRLGLLPPELYDTIYALTFTINNGTRLITDTYRPPSILQVNFKNRSNLIGSYYRDAVFRVSDESVLGKWVKAFEYHVFRQVARIELPCAYLHRLDEALYEAMVDEISMRAVSRSLYTRCCVQGGCAVQRMRVLREKLVLVNDATNNFSVCLPDRCRCNKDSGQS